MHKEMRRLRYNAWKASMMRTTNNLGRKWLGELAGRRIDLISESERVGILNCEKRKRKGWNVKFPTDRERTNLIIRERGLEDLDGGFARN